MLLAIGISLGTTYSVIAADIYAKATVLHNQDNCLTTPSYVCNTGEKILVGQPAKDYAERFPDATVFDGKRLMGRNYDDPEIQNKMKYWPFKIANKDNKPYFDLNVNGKQDLMSPEVFSSLILSYLGTAFRVKYGISKDVKLPVVITVPAHFGIHQRQSTLVAAELANFEVLQLIAEPTAAALAYVDVVTRRRRWNWNIMVIDFGGGTYDVSHLVVQEDYFQVKATGEDGHLGGQDLDNRILEDVISQFEELHGDVGLRSNSLSITQLRRECQTAKETLSVELNHKFDVKYNKDSDSFEMTYNISRERFESLCMKEFERAIKTIDDMILRENIEEADIQEIIVVGGSNQIPKMLEMIKNRFPDQALRQEIAFDHAAALGASIAALSLSKEADSFIALSDKIPKSLGVKCIGDSFEILLDSKESYPARVTRNFNNAKDYQTCLIFQIYEGEDMVASKNQLLGSLQIEIEPVKTDEASIAVTFELSRNCILFVEAKDRQTFKSVKCEINYHQKKLSSEEMESAREKLRQRENDDNERHELIRLKTAVSDFAEKVEKIFQTYIRYLMSEEARDTLQHRLAATLHDVATKKDLVSKDLQQALKEMQELSAPIMGTDTDDEDDDDDDSDEDDVEEDDQEDKEEAAQSKSKKMKLNHTTELIDLTLDC